MFQANALVTALAGIGLLVEAGALVGVMGLDAPAGVEAVGVGLLAYAGLLLWVAARPAISRWTLLLFACAEWSWVLLSILAVLDGWPAATAEGKWIIGLSAAVSAVFGDLLFYLAWRHGK